MEHAARFEDLKIELPEPIDGMESISAEVGIPEWWTTGSRVAVVIAHDFGSDMNDPLIECIHRRLAARKFLTVRFNFPFAEAGEHGKGDASEALEKAYRAALSIVGRDPAAAPSHLFLGGVGIGARVAARLATSRQQIEGAFFLGYPLHPERHPDRVQAEFLYRIIAPMLFVQGSDDARCQLAALRPCLARVGAPVTLRTIEGADHSLLLPGSSDEQASAGRTLISEAVGDWMEQLFDGR